MENFRKVLLAGISILAFSFLAVSAQAQNWVPKVEKAGVSVSVAQVDCGGYNLLMFRVENENNAERSVLYSVNYNVNQVNISVQKSVNVPAYGVSTPNCNDASTGISNQFYLLPKNANVDLNRVNINIF